MWPQLSQVLSRQALHRANFVSLRLKSGNVKPMQQVDVDDPKLQAALGRVQMGLIRKAEKQTFERAERHIKYRKKDWVVGGFCIGLAFSIYFYTMWAMKQETFLDDFELPDPIADAEEKSKN